MQMRCVCTKVTLGLKEATRSGENNPWHVQGAINAMAVSVLYKCVECSLNHSTILSYRGTPKEARHGSQIKTGESYITLTTSTDPQIMTKYSDVILTSLSQS
jgi:hypothetical protein